MNKTVLKYQEGNTTREDKIHDLKRLVGEEDRESTLALHRLHARLGFDLPGQSPRRRHEMEDQGYIR